MPGRAYAADSVLLVELDDPDDPDELDELDESDEPDEPPESLLDDPFELVEAALALSDFDSPEPFWLEPFDFEALPSARLSVR